MSLMTEKKLAVEAMATVGQMALHLSHDLNNYFQVIIGNAFLLINGNPDSHELHERAQAILKVANHGENLFRELLRMGCGGNSVQRPVYVGGIIKCLQPMLTVLVGGKDVTLTLDLKDSAPVRATKMQIEHIVLNLAMNARHAIEPPGNITISTEDTFCDIDKPTQESRYIKTTVTDTGRGIPQAILDVLAAATGVPLNGEVKGNTPSSMKWNTPVSQSCSHSGNGVGLQLVRSCVGQLDGFLQAASQPGQGSTLSVYLPTCG